MRGAFVASEYDVALECSLVAIGGVMSSFSFSSRSHFPSKMHERQIDGRTVA